MLPVRFTYLEDNGEKVYLSILGRFKHHFTGKTFYKVRREGETGWLGEDFYSEDYVMLLLNKRVEE